MAAFDPYVDLKQQLANGEVCAFVGAGLSVGAGLPGWYDLISQLSQRIGYKLPPAEVGHQRHADRRGPGLRQQPGVEQLDHLPAAQPG